MNTGADKVRPARWTRQVTQHPHSLPLSPVPTHPLPHISPLLIILLFRLSRFPLPHSFNSLSWSPSFPSHSLVSRIYLTLSNPFILPWHPHLPHTPITPPSHLPFLSFTPLYTQHPLLIHPPPLSPPSIPQPIHDPYIFPLKYHIETHTSTHTGKLIHSLLYLSGPFSPLP